LEKWPFEPIKNLLPRHLKIIQTIYEEFIKEMITKNNSTLDLKRIGKQDQKDGRKCIFAILKAKLKTELLVA
jgi:glucan phosphorylase